MTYSPRWINNSVSYISGCGTKFKPGWPSFFNCNRMFCVIFVVVSIVSMIRFGRSGGSNRGKGEKFFSITEHPYWLWEPTEPPLAWVPRFFHGGKVAGTWSPPLNCIYCRGSVGRELYLHTHYTHSWREQWRLFLLVSLALTPLITAMKAL